MSRFRGERVLSFAPDHTGQNSGGDVYHLEQPALDQMDVGLSNNFSSSAFS